MALSRRRLRELREEVHIGQQWTSLDDDSVWTVRQIHRCDGLVAIEGPGRARARVTFAELDEQFTPAQDGEQ